MRILLTGGGGLVGSNVLESARAQNHEIVAPRSSLLNLLDFEGVQKYVADCEPDIVIHAAGRVGGIQANLAAPVDFLVENLDMGRNIILASRSVGVPRFLNIGSSCMYPRGHAAPLSEEMLLTGELEPTNEGYALAKIVCERLCQYVSRDQGFEYKTIIPCNIYGRHDSFSPAKSHLIPAIIYKLHNAMKSRDPTVEIWGDGLSRREFMYAADLADCIFDCIERFDSLPSIMNIGIGGDYTINQYYEVAASVLGFKGKFVHDLTKPVGMARKIVSIDKQLAWGWQAQTSLGEGIKQTYDYFLQQTTNEV
jgi:GDP-L-fucose synthase